LETFDPPTQQNVGKNDARAFKKAATHNAMALTPRRKKKKKKKKPAWKRSGSLRSFASDETPRRRKQKYGIGAVARAQTFGIKLRERTRKLLTERPPEAHSNSILHLICPPCCLKGEMKFEEQNEIVEEYEGIEGSDFPPADIVFQARETEETLPCSEPQPWEARAGEACSTQGPAINLKETTEAEKAPMYVEPFPGDLLSYASSRSRADKSTLT